MDPKKILKQLDSLVEKAEKDFEAIKDKKVLEQVRIRYLGRKSALTNILRSIKTIPEKQRAEVGKRANEAKESVEKKFALTKNRLSADFEIKKTKDIDVTAPGKKKSIGHLNPLTTVRWQTEDIFQKMGFEVFESFGIDDDYHNFKSLNIPEGHPARDMWDTFWTEDGFIPVTHTSSMQNRILKKRTPPIRAVVLGDVFRNERTDARHEHTLIQCEGIYVDKGISLSDMIGTLREFFATFFDKDVKVRVTPDYFPFVEPGNGMELSCVLCDMKGCRVCKNTGWLEIMGCGMIHPFVLREGGVDPEVYSGFAWGFGVDRLTMLKYRIEDIRNLRKGDLGFVRQF